MQSNYRRWSRLFLFCAGLTLASGFICQWLASDFWLNNEKFSILQLEIFFSRREVSEILTDLQKPENISSRIALNYQLIFDFPFMAGVYPCIACFCMMMREKMQKKSARDILFALAILQPVAWAFDIFENKYLMDWMENPQIGDEFAIYHKIVLFKWAIALTGVLVALILTLIFAPRNKKNYLL